MPSFCIWALFLAQAWQLCGNNFWEVVCSANNSWLLASHLATPSTSVSAHYEKKTLNWKSTLRLLAHIKCINETGLRVFVQGLEKLFSFQSRLDPCLPAIGEDDTELGWIQESRLVPMLVQFRHGVFVLCSLLQHVRTVIFEESDFVLLVEQVTLSTSLIDEQVLYLKAVESYDDRLWLFSCNRLGCKAPMGMIKLGDEERTSMPKIWTSS